MLVLAASPIHRLKMRLQISLKLTSTRIDFLEFPGIAHLVLPKRQSKS